MYAQKQTYVLLFSKKICASNSSLKVTRMRRAVIQKKVTHPAAQSTYQEMPPLLMY